MAQNSGHEAARSVTVRVDAGWRSFWRTWPGRAVFLVALIIAVWLVWFLWTGLAVRRDARALQDLLSEPSIEAVPALVQQVTALDRDLHQLHTATRPLLWLAPYLGWLPSVGSDVRAAPALMEMAVAMTGGARSALEALPLSGLLAERGQGDLLAQAVPALAGAEPGLVAAQAEFAAAAAWRARIPAPVSPRITGVLDKVDRVLPLVTTALELARLAPGLLGAQGPRTYLILAENNHELRATGGFISGAGIVRLQNGRIADLRIGDSYSVDNLQQPHPDAPRVLAEQMGAQMLVLRDSNWSPDFPASAEVARILYEQDQGVATDGAVAFDLEAVRLLVGALEPLEVSEMAGPVTAANLIDQMKQAYAHPGQEQSISANENGSEWFQRRKDFMGPLMTAALQRLQTGRGVRPAALASALLSMLEGRHLQIAVDEPAAATLLAKNGWDGALRPQSGSDFLAVVDSNLGFNKTNAAVRQAIGYRVESTPSGVDATLTLTYTHTAPVLSGACDRSLRLADGTYDDMIKRCHFEYLRVYVPAGSQLLSAEGLENPTSEDGERGTTVFGGSFVLAPAHSQTVKLRYLLPADVNAASYHLQLRKQAGTDEVPFQVQTFGCSWSDKLTRDRVLSCETGKQ